MRCINLFGCFLGISIPTCPFIFIPRKYAQAVLSLSVCRRCPSVIKKLKIFIMAVLDAKTFSKQEVNDEIRHILAYVYLVKHKVLLFPAFPRSF